MVMRRPRVLFITLNVPLEGNSGGQIVTWRLLEAYSRFADVDVVALVPPDVAVHPPLAALVRDIELVPLPTYYYAHARARLVGTLAKSQLGGRPYRLAKFDVGEARRVLAEWTHVRRYDIAHLDHLSTTTYSAQLGDLPFILMEHHVEWDHLLSVARAHRDPAVRAVLKREAWRTHATEVKAVRRSAHTFTLSGDDRRLLVAADPALDPRVSMWPVPVPEVPDITRATSPSRPLTLLALGSMRSGERLPGLRWFLSHVWPDARRADPEVRLFVVGRDPPADIRSFAGRDGVEVYGFVDDLERILRDVDLCVMPLLACGGIRVKILELLARGIPCLGTPRAVRGFQELPGVYTAETPAEWLSALDWASRNSGQLRRSAELGRRALRQARAPETATGLLHDACCKAARGESSLAFTSALA